MLVKHNQQQGFERGRKNCSCPSNQFPAMGYWELIGIFYFIGNSGKRDLYGSTVKAWKKALSLGTA